MELWVAFLIFAGCMAGALAFQVTLLLPLGIGFVLFVSLAVRRGFDLKKILKLAVWSLRNSMIVVRILLIIGCLTGIWRQSGTVAYFVSLGVSLIPPPVFLLAIFLLAAAMSLALGTSFGVTATAGVILISVARAGGVNPVLAAGAILSGVYLGDRGSPAASSANLVAVLTKTDMRQNVRAMLKCSLIPFLICCALYGLFSALNPVERIDTAVLTQLEGEFSLVWYCLIPAVLMIVLPFCGMNVRGAMGISLLAALLISVFVQGNDLLSCFRAMLTGYHAKDPALDTMLSGGGVLSNLEVCGILILSGSYGEIFRGTNMLSAVNEKLAHWAKRIGRFPVMALLALGVSGLFCNQTIGAIMQNQLSADLYGDDEEERKRKMLDMENSVILLSDAVPWCIACSVPLGMLGADYRATLAAFYVWLVPLYWLIREKLRGKRDKPT